MSIKQRAKDMGVSDLVREIERLREENEMLIEDLSSDRELQQQIAQKQLDYYRENQKLKEEIEKLNLHIEAKDEAYMKLLKDYEELKNCGRYVFDCSKYDFTWLTSTTPQLEVSKKLESGSCFTK